MMAALQYLPGALVLAGIAALIAWPVVSGIHDGNLQQAADDGEGRDRG
ncbi:hypothetical protein [Methylobacterium sp. R2-1]|nr:hypothetical protein [Methylobacterium sp. R2-1]MBB2959894.1 hypothetical protein [Methylobacterium sp. R2-1]